MASGEFLKKNFDYVGGWRQAGAQPQNNFMSKPAEAQPSDPLAQLIQKNQFVGWLCHVDYEQALVLTRDDWKLRAHGVPANSFLIAAASEKAPAEIILLRVTGAAPLPSNEANGHW